MASTKAANPNEQTVLDMAHARAATSIHVPAVRNFLYGGESGWTTHSRIVRIMAQDTVFDKSTRVFMSRNERYKRALATTNRLYELAEKHNWSPQESSLAVQLLDEQVPMNLHAAAFEPVFNTQGSPELVKEYGSLIAHRGILGCYLQTELGHGTNVAGLETTATYLPATQEFEIHSPTITSSKWWIGALGKTSTHGVVQAKLILPGGKDMGPHLFFVKLRSLETYEVLPGIKIGDIGPKAMAGFAPTDNGYAMFDHIRIPRAHMLSKFAQVTAEGKYAQPPHAKLSYGGMLYIRASMIITAGWLIGKAATVSLRYTTVRRQGNAAEGLERQVITYPSVYYRLLPILSRAYVFIQLGRSLQRSFQSMSANLAKGDTSQLAEMHATTSGLKVLVSSAGVADLECARRSMGGHGYSAFSGLGRLYADYLPSMTYEGDNYVLDQQVVRAALKSHRTLLSRTHVNAASLPPSSSYLRLLLPSSIRPSSTLSQQDWKNPSTAVLLLEWRAALMVQERALAEQEKATDAGVDTRVAKAVCEAFVAAQVLQIIHDLPFNAKEKSIVADLYLLYLLITTETALTDLLSFNLLRTDTSDGRDASRTLRLSIAELCRSLLPQAIGLSDAFGFTDWELDSALGVEKGNVYEELIKNAQKEPLNKSDIPDGYEEYIRPTLMQGHRLAGKVLSSKL